MLEYVVPCVILMVLCVMLRGPLRRLAARRERAKVQEGEALARKVLFAKGPMKSDALYQVLYLGYCGPYYDTVLQNLCISGEVVREVGDGKVPEYRLSEEAMSVHIADTDGQ